MRALITTLSSFLCLGALACSSSHGGADTGTSDTGTSDTGTSDTGASDSSAPDTGPPGDWASCSLNSDCVVRPRSCCGSCGAATATDMDGVNRTRTSEHSAEFCSEPVACPACFMEQDPHLVATCDTGSCRALDLGADPITACSTDTDCVLRLAECCACGEGSVPIAVHQDQLAALGDVLCDAAAECPECEPTFDMFTAACEAGRCVAR